MVLDFGCGDGTLTECMPGKRIAAVDVREDEIERFCARTEGSIRYSPVYYDGVKLPYGDGEFDVAFAWEVLEHVDRMDVALSELHRVLKYDGHLVVSVPNKGWPFETHGLWWFPYRAPLASWLPHPIHRHVARARIFRRRDIVWALAQAGFDVGTAEYITAPLDVGLPEVLRELLKRTMFRYDTTRLSILAPAILVHARVRHD